MSVTPRASVEKQQEINQMLVAGATIKDVAAKTGETYNVVAHLRQKLVKAKVLKPLYKSKKESHQPIAKAKRLNDEPTFVLKVNNTTFNISDATSVNVSKNGVEIVTT